MGLHYFSPPRPCCCVASAQHWRVYAVLEVVAWPSTNHILSPYHNYQSWLRRNPPGKALVLPFALQSTWDAAPSRTPGLPAAKSLSSEGWRFPAWSSKRDAIVVISLIHVFEERVSRNIPKFSLNELCDPQLLCVHALRSANLRMYICMLCSYKNPETDSLQDFSFNSLRCYLRFFFVLWMPLEINLWRENRECPDAKREAVPFNSLGRKGAGLSWRWDGILCGEGNHSSSSGCQRGSSLQNAVY